MFNLGQDLGVQVRKTKRTLNRCDTKQNWYFCSWYRFSGFETLENSGSDKICELADADPPLRQRNLAGGQVSSRSRIPQIGSPDITDTGPNRRQTRCGVKAD
jgi:hypothetical protein